MSSFISSILVTLSFAGVTAYLFSQLQKQQQVSLRSKQGMVLLFVIILAGLISLYPIVLSFIFHDNTVNEEDL